jgi:ATP-dependent DNA helicase RecG
MTSVTDSELEQLLEDIESDRVERKESAIDKDKIRQTICAFANDLPGHQLPGLLFIGVDDSGRPTGIEITDQLLQNLAANRSDGNILPFPSLDVQKRRIKGCDVAVVTVHPSIAPPVRYKGAVWIRSGPRRGIANPDDERRLNEKRRFRDLPVDIHPLQDVELDSLDEMLFRRVYLPHAISPDVLAENHRSYEDQLVALRFAHPGPVVRPTMLGLLTIGKSPREWIPCDYFSLSGLTEPSGMHP